jgi:mannose-1-phosphate guanylyltransferase
MTFPSTAFVLGAGLGTRLRPLTDACPKPLLALQGRPMITHSFAHLRNMGVKRIVINTHHAAERYLEMFPSGRWEDCELVFCHEPVLLDTAGGLKNAENLLPKGESIWIYNGDIVTTLPLRQLWHAHTKGKNEVTLALRSEGGLQNVALAAEGAIMDFRNRLGNQNYPQYLYTGIGLVTADFFNRLVPGRIESLVEVWLRMIQAGNGKLGGVVLDEGTWCDVGTLAEYEKMNGMGGA